MSEKPQGWARISSRKVADCRVFDVREDLCRSDKTGLESSFFVIEAPDWVNVLAVTTQGKIVLIEQYRQGAERMILEIPGGMIDAGEEPLLGAKRELSEETGYTSSDWFYLGKSFPNPAIQNNSMHHFLARGCELTENTAFDEHEDIGTKVVSTEELYKLIRDGKFEHSLALTAIGLAVAAGKDL